MTRFTRNRVLAALASGAAILILGVAVRVGAQRGGAAQGGGGGGRAERPFAGDPILVGVIDVHVHEEPDNRSRSMDFIDLARYAKLRGMRGIVFKVHGDSTAVQAAVARREVPGFEAFGMIDLGWPLGGMNPAAIEHFTQMTAPGGPPEGYGRVVMMGSDDTVMQLQLRKSNAPPVYVVKNGQVVPEAKAVIAAIKKHNLTLMTGHNSGPEAILLIKEAIAQGIEPSRLSVTHANYNPPALTIDEMKQVAALGSFVELSGQSQRASTLDEQKALDSKDDQLANFIKQVGADHVIMETDGGQSDSEYPPDALAGFVRNMRVRGISAADTDRMTKDNPAKLLGLPSRVANSQSAR